MKNRIFRLITGCFSSVVFILSAAIPVNFWIQNPGVTEMQIFREYWGLFAMMILSFMGAFILFTDDEFIN